jgi:hypothetical protein
MASSTPGKEVSPAVAAMTIVVVVLVVVGLGWYFMFRPSGDGTGTKPSQAPRLPSHIQPPSGGSGQIARPPSGR